MHEPARVLIADDEPLFRDTTADLLSGAGYTCTCVEDAAEAARLLAEQPYDLLISDIKMPGNTRLQLVLKAHELAAGMPIILVTGYPTVDSAIEAMQLPVSAYLPKPVDIDEVLPLVEQCIARGRLFRAIVGARDRVKNWGAELDRLAELFSDSSRVPLVEPAQSLLGGSFQNLVTSLEEMGSVLAILHATEDVIPRSEMSLVESHFQSIRATLQEAIEVLEQSKYVFKSKRLGQLRRQFHDLLENLNRKKRGLHRPNRELDSLGRTDAGKGGPVL